jgi:hypothetical protein
MQTIGITAKGPRLIASHTKVRAGAAEGDDQAGLDSASCRATRVVVEVRGDQTGHRPEVLTGERG